MHWLDSVVTWEKHSDFQKEFRKMYSLTKCDNCAELERRQRNKQVEGSRPAPCSVNSTQSVTLTQPHC
ncbi:hypothetical protein SKAU_G00179720 [Synaphobranchus kaupii]|uniref:Uncharacterized protein n=1 Tax=Synaphobranchus kaupii TaxID=118154 RepID=A0A9Q1FLX7_SYNKA|nr:hypothetical protein SKAU_G00179720 [Synaphobranchus kaupii]